MKTTKIRKLFHRPVAVVMAALLTLGGIAGLASADDVQGPVNVGAGEHKTINGGIICIDSSSQVALLVDASDGEVGAKDASVTVKGNIEMSSSETGSMNHYAVFVQEKDGHASAEVEGDVTLTDMNSTANTFGLYTAIQTAGVQTPPSIHVTGKLKVKGLNPVGVYCSGAGTVTLDQTMTVETEGNIAYGVIGNILGENNIVTKVSGDVLVRGIDAYAALLFTEKSENAKATVEFGGDIVAEGKVSDGLVLRNEGGTIDVDVAGGVTTTINREDYGSEACGIYCLTPDYVTPLDGTTTVKVKNVRSDDVGIRFGSDKDNVKVSVLVKETIEAENYGILFAYKAQYMEGAASLTSEMLNYPIELTTWRIESKNKPIVAVVDTYGSISFEGDPALEKLVNYIVMSEQPSTGGSFKLVDEDGNEFPKSFDYPVAHVGDKIYIKADLDKNYEIVAAYNGIGEGKTELSKDGDQYYFKVPSGGGVNISIEVAKKAYDVTFVDEDGTTLKKYTVKLGEKPTYDGIEPSKKDDELYTYKFSGWSPEIVAVTEDTTYRATYTRSDHLYDKEVVDENYLKSEADCTHKAVYYKSCGECGEKGTETFEYGEPLDHDYKEIAGTAIAPTCTKAGKEADQKCSRCGDVITGKEIAATGHTFDQEVVDAKYLKSAADCITAAVYYKSCKCGEKSADEKDIFTSGEPAGHKWKAATGYAPKTCEVCGLEEGQKVTYDPIKGQVFVWTKGSKEPFVLTIKRSQDDVNCFLHYLNTLLDGAEIKVEAKSGSTIITISAETLEKLSVGEHLITVVFDDWKADFTLSIAEAVATPTPAVDATPVTGDTMPVVPIAVVMVVAFGAAGIAMRRKTRMNRM